MRHSRIRQPQNLPHRVLMTADTVGGVWTYALELARALKRYGVEIALATMGAPLQKYQTEQVLALSNVEIFESRFKLEWMEDPWTDVAQAGEWLLDLEHRFRPDVIHLNGYAHGALPWQAPKIVVGHSCVFSWWEATKGEPAPASWGKYYQAVKAGLEAANLVVAPSQAMLSALIRHYGPLANTEVIFNGRQLPGLKWQTKEEIILTAGRIWDEAKNISMLEKIAGQLPWPICVAGEEVHPNGSKQNVKSLQCLGSLAMEDLIPWYSRAAIYTLPAVYEPFGLSALEAGLADCALVLGDIPSLREVWGKAAVFVPPGNPEALRYALIELMMDWRRLISMGVRARNRAQELTPLRMAASYLAAYGRVLDEAPAERKIEVGESLPQHSQEVVVCAS